MPSSLIFTGLVVLWLLILVPAVTRHQQEVAHPSGASLAGRVLTRPRRRDGDPSEEGNSVDDEGASAVKSRPAEVWVPAARRRSESTVPRQSRWQDEPADDADDASAEDHVDEAGEPDAEAEPDPAEHDEADPGWERPAPRYRPGRGGFDPDADADTARRRYATRQRVVLTLLVLALLTGIAAAATLRVLWWAHAGVDVALVGYLIYLRRQVREEAAIRERRVARMAGTRRTAAADDDDLDEWARRGREVTRRPATDDAPEPDATTADEPATPEGLVDELGDAVAEDGDAARVRGAGEPIGLLPARRRGTDEPIAEPTGALPPLQPAPPPPLPPGTSLVEMDDDELELHDLGAPHRPAVGQ